MLLDHAGFTAFRGGWVGVDVFFVISGFLITGIVVREHAAGTFSFRRFYMRRVRRIVPALTAVVLLCFPFAWWLMLPDFRQNFGQSAVATLLAANNLLLARTSGYWELESGFKPLLHTWSLGVEEQFYLLYPLILIALFWAFRKRRGVVVALAGIAALSLVLATFAVGSDPDSAFYLPQFRAWELLVGGIAAFVRPTGRAIERHLPVVGLVAIVASIVLFSPEATPAPSAWMLIPTIGTALALVYGGHESLARGALSARPMVTVGLISYSAYLIHQPVFAFIRVGSLSEPSPWFLGSLILPILGLSWLSWRFIEVPFRNPTRVPSRKVFAYLVPPVAVMIVLGLVLHVGQGFPKRTYPNIDAGGDVYIGYNERIRAYTVGTEGAPADPDVVVVGNSYARDAANVLLEMNPDLEGRLAYFAGSHLEALTLEDIPRLEPAISEDTTVVIADQLQGVDEVEALVQAVVGLDPAAVYIFGTKDFGWNLNPYGRLPMDSRSDARAVVSEQYVELNDAFEDSSLDYVDVIRLIGGDGVTVPVFDSDGNPLSPDRSHLTRYGAEFVAERLVETRSPLASLGT